MSLRRRSILRPRRVWPKMLRKSSLLVPISSTSFVFCAMIFFFSKSHAILTKGEGSNVFTKFFIKTTESVTVI